MKRQGYKTFNRETTPNETITKTTNVDVIVKKLKNFLKSEFAKCEWLLGNWRSGAESKGHYNLYKISASDIEGTLIIARDITAGLYMAQFECTDGALDIYIGWNTRDNKTVRWRHYSNDGKYQQGYLKRWFLSEETSETMYTIIRGTGVENDGHEGHYFHTIIKVENT